LTDKGFKSVMLTVDEYEYLADLQYQMSGPGNRVSISKVVRVLIDSYQREHDMSSSPFTAIDSP
jgi:hypothetical protein